MKKLFTILLSLAMLVCFMPTMAFGAGVGGTEAVTNEASIGAIEYATLQEAVDKAADEHTVKLLKTVTSDKEITLIVDTETGTTGKAITLDLNGFEISNSKTDWGRAICVQEGASLTVIDTSKNKNGKIMGSYAGLYVFGNIANNDGKFNDTPIDSTLVIDDDITISGGGYGIVHQGNGAKVVINKGNINTTQKESIAISGNGNAWWWEHLQVHMDMLSMKVLQQIKKSQCQTGHL